MERTYIMVKPDGVQRGLVGRVIARFEDKGMRLVGLKMVMAEDDILEEHYAELKVAEQSYIIFLVDWNPLETFLCRSAPSSPG